MGPSRRNLALLAFCALCGLLITAPWGAVRADDDDDDDDDDRRPRRCRLTGTWVGKTDGGDGFIVTFIPTSSANKEASFTVRIFTDDPTLGGLFPDVTSSTGDHVAGHAVRTGRDSFDLTWIMYGLDDLNEPVYAFVGNGSLVLTECGTTYEESTSISLFSMRDDPGFVLGPIVDQDADDDFLPDDGEDPVLCIPFTSVVKRLQPDAPCEP